MMNRGILKCRWAVVFRACAALICSLCVTAQAGVTEGDLFGYRLGARFPVSASTKGYWSIGRAVLIPEKPEIPTEFRQLELLTTPQSFTIGNIYATAELPDKATANALASKYKDLLPTLYGTRCIREKEIVDWIVLDMRCGQYQLTINVFDPDKQKAGDPYKVQIGLQPAKDSKPSTDWAALFDAELKAAEQEASQRRLDRAKRDQSLRGFK